MADGGLCLMRGTRPQYDPTNQHIVGCGASANPPRLLFLHFGAVDFRGHACPTGPTCGDGGITYQEAIQQVDAQIHDKIWAEIARGQNPEFTTANTVVLITTDHGRESFSAQDHGGLDWANRAIFLFGRGPGIPGQLFTDRPTALPGELGCQRKIPVAAAFFPCRQQEDLAPTVASLFGVAMPDSEGVVMAELLGGSPPAFPAQPSEPRVQAGGQGSLHVVWTERDTTTGDRVVRYLRQDPPLPTSFTLAPGAGTPISVTADAEGRRLTATQPYLFVRNASGQDRVLVAYSVTRSVQDSRIISGTGVGGDNVADVYLSSSTDGGATWTKERVAQSVLETEVSPTPVMYLAPATVAEVSAPVVRRWVFASRPAAVLGFSRDGTDPANPPVTIATSPNCPETLEALEDPPDQCPSEAFFPQRLDAAMQASGNRIELVWQTVSPDARWDVYRSTKLTFDGSWSAPAAVTGTTDQLTGHLPAVTLQGTTRNVLWAEDQGSVWRVRGSRASSAISGDNAFLPDAVASSASNMYAAYSRVNPATGDYDIYRNRSTNGGQIWLGEVELTPPGTPDPSLFPSVTWDAQGTSVWAVWREGSSPTWQIKGQLVFTEV